MLKDQLDKILNPQTTKDLFAQNEQGILYERLIASLKEAVMGIKTQMMEDMEKMSDKMAQDFVSKIKDSPVYKKLIASMEETAMGMKDKMKVETEPIILRNVQQAISKIKIPKDGERGKDGKDAVIDEKKIIEEITKEIPKIDQAQIIAEIMAKIPRQSGGRGGGGSTMRVNNLSSQCDGVSKSFVTTNRIGEAHLIHYSSFPNVFLPTTDYSVSGNTITLGAGITAPEAGQSLVIIYESSD